MACRVKTLAPPRAPSPLPPAFGVRVAVPVPPSVNNLFINVGGRGRVPSREYTAWKRLAQPLVRAKLPPPPAYPVEVNYLIRPGKGWRVNADVANREKGLTDALVAAGVLPDDDQRYVTGVRIAVDGGARRSGPTDVLVWLEPASDWWSA